MAKKAAPGKKAAKAPAKSKKTKAVAKKAVAKKAAAKKTVKKKPMLYGGGDGSTSGGDVGN
jgi:hypothetical protein